MWLRRYSARAGVVCLQIQRLRVHQAQGLQHDTYLHGTGNLNIISNGIEGNLTCLSVSLKAASSLGLLLIL